MNVAVTGAGGYLGSRLAAAFRAHGSNVDELKRSGDNAVPFTLADGSPEGYFRDAKIEVLVHCAWDFSLVRKEDIYRVNVGGSMKLLEQAHREGVKKIIFISTISAYPGCKSLYGQAKLAIEEQARQFGAIVIRPGVVFGEKPGAIVGAMAAAMEKLPVVPLIGNGRQTLYPCHEDDLAQLVITLATSSEPGGMPIIAAGENGWTFREILAGLAKARGRKLRLLSVPWRAVWMLIWTAERVGLRPGFRSDSVISLVTQNPAPDFGPTRQTPVTFRDFSALTGSAQMEEEQ